VVELMAGLLVLAAAACCKANANQITIALFMLYMLPSAPEATKNEELKSRKGTHSQLLLLGPCRTTCSAVLHHAGKKKPKACHHIHVIGKAMSLIVYQHLSLQDPERTSTATRVSTSHHCTSPTAFKP
jgi:hypothetical protein